MPESCFENTNRMADTAATTTAVVVVQKQDRWKPGPDSPASWAIAGACFIITFVTFGLMRCYGIIYVSVLHVFDANRQEASWPFSVSAAAMNLTGPLAGLLNSRFGTRIMVISGSLMAAIGSASCFLAPNILFVTIAFGVVQGLGAGLVMLQVPVTVNQFFVRYRTTAQGVAFSGATIATFVYPPLLEYCVDTYGLRGTFLIIGGIILHAAIGGALIRRPPWVRPKASSVRMRRRKTDEVLFQNSDSGDVEDSRKVLLAQNQANLGKRIDVNYNGEYTSCKQNVENGDRELELAIDRSPEPNGLGEDDRWSSKGSWKSHHMCSPVNRNVYNRNGFGNIDPTESLLSSSDNSEDPPKVIVTPSCEPRLSPDRPVANQKSSMLAPDMQLNKPSFVCSMDSVAVPATGIEQSTLSVVKSILTHPIFYLVSACWASFLFGYITYILVIVDSAIDNGIAESDAVLIYSTFSIGDIIGRLGLGWVTDRGYVKRKNFAMSTSIMMGVTLLVIPLQWSYAFQLVASVLVGISVGSTMILFVVLFADYMEPDEIPMAIGLGCFINGVISLGRPFLVGYFRDTLGSYNKLFYTVGALSVCCPFLFLLEPTVLKWRVARQEVQAQPESPT